MHTESPQVQLIGRKLRTLRKKQRLTQAELALRVGIHQSDLSRMERGEYRVSLDTLLRLLTEFQVGIGEFFGEQRAQEVTPKELFLARAFSSLEPQDQQEVEALIAARNNGADQDRADHGDEPQA